MIFQTFVIVALLAVANARPNRRAASCTFPTPPSTSSLSSPRTIEAGESFDGGNVSSTEETEGASLSNVVIGADQSEGIHCLGSCTLTNVWFEDVCEDAITIKQTSGTSTISGGGAKGADDKVIQHNGGGTVAVDSFCVEDFGKLYRSCGNCDDMYERHSTFSNIIATDGSSLAGINSNYGDTAIFDTDTIQTSNVDSICDTYEGNDTGDEPTQLTSNASNDYCQF
ncbi:polysaccharide lyase family 3 protein [Desarmillaria tabescens]|uniref:Pectate lyase n=1 Tax=Armillaria tabescens TaxID=1929756 RepID=A0AA39K6B2_ARMTA|nr:polysaccharide lyase family 3 protein [Desarmillaria tabescens]KAK0455305.1 polysaccharide lyase family 3 protein [Desarmillaria tabescens]